MDLEVGAGAGLDDRGRTAIDVTISQPIVRNSPPSALGRVGRCNAAIPCADRMALSPKRPPLNWAIRKCATSSALALICAPAGRLARLTGRSLASGTPNQ